jgi:NAD(P)-dependent dehydrogenase (short-subunit alcohol dehydrogenase family)
VLFNNAGVVMQKRTTTVDGLETTFAVNHLGYFLLTNLLLERLRASAPSRVVCTASDAHKFGGAIDFDDLQMEKSYPLFGAYGRSKAANILFASELGRREAETGVVACAYHPGFVGSDFSKNNGALAKLIMVLGSPFARSPAKGAETGVYLCTAPEVTDDSGAYYFNMKLHQPAPHARSQETAKRLWDVSERLTGLSS